VLAGFVLVGLVGAILMKETLSGRRDDVS